MNGRTGTIRPSDEGAAPEVIVRRIVDGATVQLSAQLDTALQSGDSIEIRAASQMGAALKRAAIAP
jgi:hypothetical protein